jgi:hypothetical protein
MMLSSASRTPGQLLHIPYDRIMHISDQVYLDTHPFLCNIDNVLSRAYRWNTARHVPFRFFPSLSSENEGAENIRLFPT